MSANESAASKGAAVLKRFETLYVLGKGFFGEVSKVRDRQTGQLYALKKVPKKHLMKHKLFDKIVSEIRIMYKLEHANIIKLLFHFEDEQHIYLGLEYASGGELFSRLRKVKRLGNPQAARYVYESLEALKYLHSQNPKIIHRDLKPENILLDGNDRIKLCDFGYAKPIEAGATATTFCGTLDYLAPEMIKGSGHDESVDCWAMGVLLFELLVGQSPFAAAEQTQTTDKIQKRQLQFPADIDPDAKDLIDKLLRLNPKERPSVAEAQKHPYFVKYGPKQPAADVPPVKVDENGELSVSVTDDDDLDLLRDRLKQLECANGQLQIEIQNKDARIKKLEAGVVGDLEQQIHKLTSDNTLLRDAIQDYERMGLDLDKIEQLEAFSKERLIEQVKQSVALFVGIDAKMRQAT
eukprot:CAMPEP_0204274430 /NCGR_PEP_ID=MMETSP0468-20130131/25183_1 /ASSEMBLY_ACC=CAM_ASM_000383 /TAXON_ID=2969 /ORGANISM="Oxyrrhis marina" /LENGTH=407 /DNA_ID=CAMNT_0051250639 /DNA_START=17 /DNA_END=1240 /DNA_ORIENTATION=-